MAGVEAWGVHKGSSSQYDKRGSCAPTWCLRARAPVCLGRIATPSSAPCKRHHDVIQYTKLTPLGHLVMDAQQGVGRAWPLSARCPLVDMLLW